MADETKTTDEREDERKHWDAAQRLGTKSTAPNSTKWRPDVTTQPIGQALNPQEQNFPNDSAHHV